MSDGWPPALSAARLPKDVGAVLAPFVASRLMVAAVVLVSRLQLPQGHFRPEGGLLSVLSGGDAGGYLRAAQSGGLLNVGGETTSSFFPVFPFLVRVVSIVFTDVAFAGVLVANLALLAAGILLHALMRLEYDDPRISRYAVMLLMFSPASYFFTCAVPDSTALALAIASLLAAVSRRWLVACACAVLLCGTMNAGFCIIVPLLIECVRQTRPAGAAGLLTPPTLTVMLILLLLIGAVIVGYSRFRDPFALLQVSENFARVLRSLLKLSTYFKGYATFYEWLFRTSILAAVLLCIAGYVLKVRLSFLGFVIAIAAVCLLSHDLQAARTIGLAFPLFAIMGVLSARLDWMYDTLLACSMVLLALCTTAAANGFWIS